MYAEIIGWGKCAPPAVLTNKDLESFMETSDEWIQTRTGIKQRHVSHVPCSELSRVAAERAIACAGIKAEDIDLVILGTTSPDEIIPNSASIVVNAIGAVNATGFDINSACTSFLYSLNVATDMIKAGSIKTALVIGMEKVTRYLDWEKRDSAVLFGDGGGAVVLQATEEALGLIDAKLSLVPETREMIHIPGLGMDHTNQTLQEFHYSINFTGQDVFKHAVRGMYEACDTVLARTGISLEDIDFFIPHQANLRIIQTLAKRMHVDMENVMVCVDKYANTSAGTIPLSLCDALEAGRIKPGMTMLTASFGAGLTCGGGLIKWGERVVPLGESDAELPPCNETALELIQPAIDFNKAYYAKKAD
ncbi:MAG: ketoacyl-ACP synthase III [Gammaproteobacteria bacterium]|nr:ketoacyl-ACP synthase III [Gammaproteobacteria bacterium]MDH5631021.1 ketoacyl-ACP synthase III [Gammaproteobacteria bacterium]